MPVHDGTARIARACFRGAAYTARLWLPFEAPKLDSFAPSSPESLKVELDDGICALNDSRIDESIHIFKRLVNIDCAKSDIKRLRIKHVACHYLAVALHHGFGRLDEAVFWWREHLRLSAQLASQYGKMDTQGVHIYEPFWSNHVGHAAMMGIWAKRSLLEGTTRQRHYFIHDPVYKKGNSYLVQQMGQFFTLIDDYAQLPYPREYIEAVSKYLYINTGRSSARTYFWQVFSEISNDWENAALGPLLEAPDDDLNFCANQRKAMGVPENAWHVCLHVRSSGYKDSHDNLHAALNADIGSYDLAISSVVRRGGWIIRMGDPSMPKLESAKNVIDYAHSRRKSPKLDILLCATSRFYIGTSSGLGYVPALYGVPSVFTNWFPTGTRPLNKSDLFIPKLHWYEIENEFAQFDDSLAPPLGHIHLMSQFKRLGITLRPNTRDELRGVVEEMLDRLEGGADYTIEDERLQARFDAVACRSRSYGNARVGRDFLRKFQDLLPTTVRA